MRKHTETTHFFTATKVKNINDFVIIFIDYFNDIYMQTYTVISHVFDGWNVINAHGDMTSILKTPRSSLKVFERFDTIEERTASQTTFVAYIVEKNKVIAFGCATHFLTNQNYYEDGDEECDCVKCKAYYGAPPPCENGSTQNCYIENQSTRRLWVEGMASLKKGCGTLILQELERWLFEQGKIGHTSYSSSYSSCPINLMAVDESMGFYDKRGYVACNTSPYWAGSECARMVKFENEEAKVAQTLMSEVLTYWDNMGTYNDDKFCDLLANLIGQDRVLLANRYMKLPVSRDLAEYVLDHQADNIYGDSITKERKEILIEYLEEYYGEGIAKKKATKIAKKMWQDKFKVKCVTSEQRKTITTKIKSFIDTIESIESMDERLSVFIEMLDYMTEEGYKMCTHKRFKQTVKDKCKSELRKKQFKTNLKPKTREFVFALTGDMMYLPYEHMKAIH
jgi:hypothetical protein